MTKLIASTLIALTLAMSGCGTTKLTQEETQRLASINRSSPDLKFVAEGRIVSTRIGRPPAKASAADTIGMNAGSSALGAASTLIGLHQSVRNMRDVFHITYTTPTSDKPQEFYTELIPGRPDLYTKGKYFRFFQTKDRLQWLRLFETEEEFNAFNQ